MQSADEDFITELVSSARDSIREGYYSVKGRRRATRNSLKGALLKGGGLPIIAEVKFRSPAEGILAKSGDAARRAREYERGGAVAISVLTEPKHFLGNITDLVTVKKSVKVPVLMKDIVIESIQLEAANVAGADAVLLIETIFERGLGGAGLGPMISRAHSLGLEVLLETHTEAEYASAIKSDADVVGINNRDMESLKVSLDTSKRILGRYRSPKPVVCESGITSREQALELRMMGADAVLVGSALMNSGDPGAFLRELVG